ncbi:hypothetical protein FDF69_07965 [Clostridium sporogenes]|uniref:hypothetical protein n=1 Tax=Clostridium sporogenes TaxID=1509 RepID=UPI0013D4E3F9|nr:hypothetical protein [Clostridium sporogenes]MDU5010691.1 hypothetical protein [Clostridium botulinum]NFF66833.1 hypothetical protein [Clostridium sporogenes]NFF99393.1 hypothetical protein [Clostridium sporogenes]NFG06901.1 hypothetical protein [Clostridium sporogenes]NFG51451.1 hypothetical protein [Clostridium sporogenes]
MNEERRKLQAKKSISKNPTHIILMRNVKASNGMRGGTEKPDKVAELDIFLDDTKHNLILDNVKESGIVKRTRGISMFAVTEGIEIKEGDYFEANGYKYIVTYPGMIIKDVYNSDLEVIKNG